MDKRKKTIEVLIKVPQEWLEGGELEMLGLLRRSVKEHIERQVLDQAVEQILEKLKVPKMTISPKQVKDRVLTLLAERVLEESHGG